MAGMFDDLIPQGGGNASPGISFDDLIPKKPASQQRAEADAAKRAANTPGLVRALNNGFAFGAAGNIDAAGAALETGLHNAFAHATGQPDSGYGMKEAFNAVRGAEANASNTFAQQHPVQNVAANVVGAVANPVNALAGRFVGQAPGVLNAIGRSAVTGGALGAAYGAGGTQPGQSVVQNAKQGAEAGAVVGAAAPVVGAVARGVGRAVGVKSNAADYAPVVAGLKAAKNAAYQAVDNMGAAYTPDAAKSLAQGIEDELSAASISDVRHPKASDMLQTVKDALTAGKPVTLTQLDQLRQVISRDVAGLKGPDNGAERLMGQKMIDNIDEFIQAAGPDQMVNGSGPEAASAIQRARAMNTQFRKADKVVSLVESADQKGGNVAKRLQPLMDPTSRQQIRNFTPAEQNALNTVVRGTPAQNAIQSVAQLSPEGRLMPVLHVAAAAGTHGLSAIGSVAGFVAKHISDQQTAANVTALVQTIADGAPGETTNAERQLAFMATKDPQVASLYRELRQRLAGAAPGLAASSVNQMNQMASAPAN